MTAVKAFHVGPGMEVRSSDHKKLGTVAGVRLGSDRFQYIVVESRWLFRAGGRRIYVPVRQVESVSPDGTIALACAKRVARKEYRHLPLSPGAKDEGKGG